MFSDNADFVPNRLRERVTAQILRLGLRVALKPMLSPRLPIAWQRHWLEVLARWMPSWPTAKVEPAKIAGVSGEWVRTGATGSDQGALLYLHGGGYCVGSPTTHRAVTTRLAAACGLPVFVADYRLAPEHVFPAALEDAVAVFVALAASGPVVIAGDSAGAGLSLATALLLRERDMKLPAALVLFSPWIDLALAPASESASTSDPMLGRPWLNFAAQHYVAGGDATAPHVSPIYGDLRELPPTLIQAGADEILNRDARTLQHALERSGVAVRCELVPDRWHAFQLHAGLLPSADAAIDRAATFLAAAVAHRSG